MLGVFLAWRWMPVLAALALLTACGQSRGPTTAAPGPQPRQQGIYKVGEPYQINGVWYYPAEDFSYTETGIASFYGGEASGVDFHGRFTANGEIYDMNALTAAHQTLPMPSLVRVTNLDNGRSLVLRVNDRGPFVRGRIIDVSRRGAQLLGFHQKGTAPVRVEILAEESRVLKIAALNGLPVPDREAVVVAAVPRPTVSSDALAPVPGTRIDSAPATTVLPAPASLPQQGGGTRPQPRLSPPIIATPAPALQPVPTPQPAPPPRPAMSIQGLPVAALPVAQQGAATAVVTQVAVRPTSIYVQAGAFTNYDNAYRLGARLSRYGHIKVLPTRVSGIDLYRVRIGPARSVEEGDRLLEQVAAIAPDARIVVD